MNAQATIFVDCIEDESILRTYDFLAPFTAGLTVPPSDEELILEAKSNLTTEQLATPPYSGIRFVVRR